MRSAVGGRLACQDAERARSSGAAGQAGLPRKRVLNIGIPSRTPGCGAERAGPAVPRGRPPYASSETAPSTLRAAQAVSRLELRYELGTGPNEAKHTSQRLQKRLESCRTYNRSQIRGTGL